MYKIHLKTFTNLKCPAYEFCKVNTMVMECRTLSAPQKFPLFFPKTYTIAFKFDTRIFNKWEALHLNSIKPIIKVLVQSMNNSKVPIINEDTYFLYVFCGTAVTLFYYLTIREINSYHFPQITPNFSLTLWKFYKKCSVDKNTEVDAISTINCFDYSILLPSKECQCKFLFSTKIVLNKGKYIYHNFLCLSDFSSIQ